MKVAILGGRVIDPSNQFDGMANLFIADGVIVQRSTAPWLDFKPDLTIKAEGLIICPGLVDIKANILSFADNSRAFFENLKNALAAGITHLATPAFSDRCLHATEIKYLTRASDQHAKVYFIGALTQNLQGKCLNELVLLKEAGCIGFTNGYYPVQNTLIKKRCYNYASMLGLKIFMVLNDSYLTDNGCMHQGIISTQLGLPGIPVLSEAIALAKELLLIEETGIAAHFYHLSAKKTVDMLEKAGKSSTISSDVAIHQLFLTEKDVSISDGFCHVRPPFRTEYDKESMRGALKKGNINAISTDHIRVSQEKKEVPFQDSAPGIASWPLLLPLTLKFAAEDQIPLIQALGFITTQPALALGIDAGHLCQGKLANILLFDPAQKWSLSEEDLGKFGSNNPFKNWPLQGRVKYTFVDGQLAYKDSYVREK
jgi:dihydroorotase